MTPAEAFTFIRAETVLQAVPLAPEIRLHLAAESIPLWRRTEEELAEIGLPPPFWAFAWAGGQALSRYVLDHPRCVSGKSVLDFASGSGLVGIAAAKAGAKRVVCAEIDPFAAEAIELNAAANDVSLDVMTRDIIGDAVDHDVLLIADIFYEQALALRVMEWLQKLHDGGKTILIGDPGRAYLPKHRLEILARYQVPVTRDLEDAEIKASAVWKIMG